MPGNPGFLPPTHPFHSGVEQYDFDPETANELLEAAGYRMGPSGLRQTPGGQPLRLGLLVDAERAAVAELVVGALRTIGIEVAPDFVDLVRLFQYKSRGNYDLAIAFFPGPSGISANCAEACGACASKFEKYDDEVMRQCAEACRRAAEQCRQLAA